MKKLIAMLLVLAMILSFATVFTACGDDYDYVEEDDDDDDKKKDDEEEEEEEEEEDPSNPSDPSNPGSTVNAEEAAAEAMLTTFAAYWAGRADDVGALIPADIWTYYTEYEGGNKDAMIAAWPRYAQENAPGLQYVTPENLGTMTFELGSELKALTADDIRYISKDMEQYHGWKIATDTVGYSSTVTVTWPDNVQSYAVAAIKDADGNWYAFGYDGSYIECYPKHIAEDLLTYTIEVG